MGSNQRGTSSNKKPDRGAPKWPRLSAPLGYFLLFVLGVLLFRSFFQDAGVQKIGYSQFKQAISDGTFSRVLVSDDWLKGFVREEPGDATGAAQGRRKWVSQVPLMAYRVEGDTEFIGLLEENNIPYEAQAPSGLSEAMWLWLLPLGVVFIFWSVFLRRMVGGAGQGPQGVMGFGKSRAKVRSESDTGVGFSDVAGIDEAVEELKEIVEFLKTPEKFRRLGGRIPKGVLLMGPPGTGKTLLARAVAGEAGVPFFSLSGSEFVEMFVGVGAARVRDLFAQAAAKAPCIVFIDELDAIGKSRNSGYVGGHDEREQTLNQLLAEMDGFDSKVGLIVLAATNRPEVLDSALLRPGRFDRQVLVDRPDMRGRERILQIHARHVKLADEVDLRVLSSRTPGFAGADLANVVNEAALLAARKGHVAVLKVDFEEAIERVVAGLEKKNRRMNDKEKFIVAHHEAGHAIVSWMLPHAERIQKVSIIPRGLAALGYTLSMPLEDRYLLSFDELRDKMAGMMGGRAAEELFVGEISTGASNDLKQATDLARLMVCEYGMSELGPLSLSPERPVFLRAPPGAEVRQHSERTAEKVDDEIQRMVAEALHRAREVLAHSREKVEAIAERLLALEVLEEDELVAILGPRGQAEDARAKLPAALPVEDRTSGPT